MGKRILFEEICNFRDLGEFNTNRGGFTKTTTIYRSSMLFGPTGNDKTLFQSLNLQSIIDLRSPKEISLLKNPYQNDVKHYLPINLSGSHSNGRLLELAKANTTDNFISQRYLEYLETGKEEIIKLFHFFLNSSHFPLVIHCSAGKDRTGIIVYLILSLHQVPLEEILADYQVSYTYIQHDDRIIKDKETLNIYQSEPDNLEIFHNMFIEKYSSVTNYFKGLNFSENEIKALSNLL